MKRWTAVLCAVALLATIGHAAPVARRIIPLDFDGAALDTTAVGMADSTGILPTSNYQQIYLWLKPNKPCKIAIQIRAHGITDTSGASLPDTAQTAVWPWRTFTFVSTTVASDTLTLSQTTQPTSIQAGANELTVYFPTGINPKWGGARGMYIPLRGTDGNWYWGRNTSVRLRVLTAYGANEVVTWSASLHGVSF